MKNSVKSAKNVISDMEVSLQKAKILEAIVKKSVMKNKIVLTKEEFRNWLVSYFQSGLIMPLTTDARGKSITELTHQAWEGAEALAERLVK